MHATAVYSDSATGERSYETNHWQNAFVHTFTDDTQILQVADFNYVSWGCCHTGNQFLLNNELCQSHDADKFAAAYDRWVWLAAYQLYARKLGVTDKVTLWSHKEVSDTYHETDHQDPIAYLTEHGKTWNDVVNDVTNYYNQMEQEDKEMDELKQQIAAMQAQIDDLQNKACMKEIPDWAKEAVDAAVTAGLVNTPEGGSFDFYRLITVLHRKGII